MVVVFGREPGVMACIAEQLRALGQPTRLPTSDELDDALRERDATVHVAIEPLSRVVEGPAEPDDDVLRQSLSAAWSPAHPILVWVTQRPDDDPMLRELRQSGAPYIVVRPGALITRLELGLSEPSGRKVYVARGLPVPDAGVTALLPLGEAVARACAEDTAVGRTLDLARRGDDAWCDIVRDLGGEPKVLSRTLVEGATWIGRPAIARIPGDEPNPTVGFTGFEIGGGWPGVFVPPRVDSGGKRHDRTTAA